MLVAKTELDCVERFGSQALTMIALLHLARVHALVSEGVFIFLLIMCRSLRDQKDIKQEQFYESN
jgi:hypothetical protein